MTPAPALAKLSAPAVEKVLARTRLFRRIDQSRKRRVVWVTGPPGAGKTTLISSYIARCRLACLWYQVDGGDADVATFFHYLGLAAKRAAPHYRKPLPHLTPEYLAGLPVFARRYFEALALRLKPPCVLVFDNYQDVSAESPLHGVLCEGLSALPEGFTTIVISRADPPAALARLRANEELSVIGWDDLQLTPEETAGIGRLRKPKGHTAASFEDLHRKTQGWTAGLILLLEQDQTGQPVTPSLQDRSPQALFDYFASEIFSKMAAEAQHILLASALLPKMTASMVEQLTGSPAAGRLLDELDRRNYFTLKHPGAEAVYEYHPLFREFLLAGVKAAYAPEPLIDVKKRAAALLDADGQIEPAVALLQESGDWNGVARLSLKHAQPLISQGRSHTLEAWLKSLPPEPLAQTPWLLYWLGVCRLAFAPAEAREYFERAYAHFKSGDELPGMYLAWCALVDSFIYEWGNFKPLDRWITEMEELLRNQPAFPSPDIEAQVTCGMFLALMYPQPHHPDLPLWEQRVWQIMQTSADTQLRMKVGNHLLIYYTWWTGDLAKAELLVNTQRTLMQMPGTAPLVRATWHTMAAGYFWMSAANEDGIACVDQGLEISRTDGVHTWDMLLCAQGMFASLSSGQTDAAVGYLKYMERLWSTSRPMDAAVYYYLSAWDSLMRQNLPAAYEQAKSALSLAEDAGARFPAAVFRNDCARVLFYLGKPEEAQALVQQARAEGRAMRAQTIEYLTLLTEAEMAMERQDEAACLEHLRGCLAVGREQGFQNHTWWRSEVMVRLYAKALEHQIEVDYVRSLIRKRRLPPPAGSAAESWPWPIKIYSLGHFTILKDDMPLKSTGKLQRKPLELLKALIAAGAEEVNQSSLIEALWPDAEGDNAEQAFDTALYRLRKLLGHEAAVVLKDGKLTVDARYGWVDSRALERLFERTDAALQAPATAPAAFEDLVEQLFLLYAGHFLAEESAPWALPLRERLRSRFLRTLEQLGRRCEAGAEWDQAVRCYQRGLEVEPLAETLYYRLMCCYQRLGQPAEALAVYRRCRQTLSTLLGIGPSPEIEALRRTLDAPRAS